MQQLPPPPLPPLQWELERGWLCCTLPPLLLLCSSPLCVLGLRALGLQLWLRVSGMKLCLLLRRRGLRERLWLLPLEALRALCFLPTGLLLWLLVVPLLVLRLRRLLELGLRLRLAPRQRRASPPSPHAPDW